MTMRSLSLIAVATLALGAAASASPSRTRHRLTPTKLPPRLAPPLKRRARR